MTIEQLEAQVYELTRRVYRLELHTGAARQSHPSPIAPTIDPAALQSPSVEVAMQPAAAIIEETNDALRHLRALKAAKGVERVI